MDNMGDAIKALVKGGKSLLKGDPQPYGTNPRHDRRAPKHAPHAAHTAPLRRTEKIYIGGWFQRTMMHLSEIHQFLAEGTSDLALAKEHLDTNRKALDINGVSLIVDGFETVKFVTNAGINVKVMEDGLIVVNKSVVDGDIRKAIDEITKYYEEKLAPAFSYLFSLGAPVPKELATIRTVLPFFIVVNGKSDMEMGRLFTSMDRQKYANYGNDSFDTFGGEKYFFINVKKKNISDAGLENYIEETMFFREFRGQLQRYLNLHRTIWSEVPGLKERAKIKQREVQKCAARLDDIYKTITLVDTRINQMGTYFATRESIAKSDPDFEKFLGIMEYRYETLSNSLEYIKELWTMTKNYVLSAQKLFKSLEDRITQKILSTMNIIFGVMLASTLINLLQGTKFPAWSWWGLAYSAFILASGFTAIKIIQFVATRGKLRVGAKTYETFE